MELKGKMRVEITKFLIKSNEANDGKEAELDIELAVSDANAEKLFGPDFKTLAFSTMAEEVNDDGESHVTFLQDKIKPGKKIVFPVHTIILGDHELKDIQPKLLNLKPVKGTAAVVAHMRLPIDTSKTAAINFLVKNVGDTIDTQWNPKQGKLPFSVVKGDKSKNPKATVTAESTTMQ